jgi:hypothetical protein
LLKKEKAWNWIERRKCAFEEIKPRIVIAPTLKLPNFDKSFEVKTYVSDFPLEGFSYRRDIWFPLREENSKIMNGDTMFMRRR